ncbi:Alpha/Beta hydrolase protein [Leptodontidium sp. MPI-SDFR-AT-0119]|nr:Alpha/Beta hydrolase protein [Leptodontidium sp. MPI-SDFR-AT-0119]
MNVPHSLLAIALFAFCAFAQCQTNSSGALPTVDLGYTVHQASSKNGIYNFTNIRYGQPPIGDLRFQPPVAPINRSRGLDNGGLVPIVCYQASSAWTTTAFSVALGVNVSQLSYTIPPLESINLTSIPTPLQGESEDCLFLDVFAPQDIFNACNRSTGGVPVMVWIHGGGYVVGSKSTQGSSGDAIGLLKAAQQSNGMGAVFVSLNYRLGAFGWLAGPSYQSGNAATNLGLLDQQLALKWIRDNISKFGGDPSQVTLMGESAGGGSVTHQLLAYGGKHKVPFHRAIIQSPAVVPSTSPTEQDSTFAKVLEHASYVARKPITTVQQLRELTTEQNYLTNYVTVMRSEYGGYPYGPVVDGVLIPNIPAQMLQNGQFDTSVELMIGHNLNEGALFASPFITNETAFHDMVARRLPSARPEVITHITQTLYPPDFTGVMGYKTFYERNSLFESEVTFTCNTRNLNLATGNQSFSYYFTVPNGLHGMDIAYTFFDGISGTTIFRQPVNATIATVLQTYMTNFAIRGSPDGAGVPIFPAYGANSSLQVLGIEGEEGSQVVDPTANERCAWWARGEYL